MLATRHLTGVSPANEKRAVEPFPPVRLPNSEYRTREYLTEREVDRLIEAARANRSGQRDSTMVLVAFRHGLRVSELIDLRWEQVDLNSALLHVRRVKSGTPATHPLTGVELTGIAQATARPGAQVAIRLCIGAWRPFTMPGLSDAD